MLSSAGVGGTDWQRAHGSILGCREGSDLDGGHRDICNKALNSAPTHLIHVPQ